MNAEELRKSLDNGLRADSSGKTTPMGRLTPFLHDLVNYLEDHEKKQHPETYQTISSDAPTQAAPASTTSEQGNASKATA